MTKKATSLETSAERLASALPPLLIEAQRVAETVYQGVHGRRHAGQGDEFWQYRHYSPGDSPRKIDWRRSAKSDRSSDNSGIFIRQKEWESAQSLWLWNGSGPGMNWSSHKSLITKKHRASVLSLALAHLLIRGGEKVALLGSGVAPSNSRKTLHTLSRQLDAPAENQELPTGYHLPQHAALVCFSDFLTPLQDQKKVFDFLANQNLKIWLVQILDPAEMNLPYTGRVKFQAPSGEQELVHADVESIREIYIDRIRAHNEDLSRLIKKWGWQHIIHTTDNPAESILLSLYQSISERQSSYSEHRGEDDYEEANSNIGRYDA